MKKISYAFIWKKSRKKKYIVEDPLALEIIHCGLSVKSFIEFAEESITFVDKLINGVPKEHPLSPFDSKEKFGYRILSGKIIKEK